MENDRKKKEQIINDLKGKVATLNETRNTQKQFAPEFFNTEMDVNIKNHDLARTHRIGKN